MDDDGGTLGLAAAALDIALSAVRAAGAWEGDVEAATFVAGQRAIHQIGGQDPATHHLVPRFAERIALQQQLQVELELALAAASQLQAHLQGLVRTAGQQSFDLRHCFGWCPYQVIAKFFLK